MGVAPVPGAAWPGELHPMEEHMYHTPRVERFGTLRELTRGGKSDPGWDLAAGLGNDNIQPGCTAEAAPGSAASCVSRS
jgi:hypothetical protein